jgi:arylsulfatase A-like enzyme
LKAKSGSLTYKIQRAYDLARIRSWTELDFKLRRNLGRLLGPVAEIYSLIRDAILYRIHHSRLFSKSEIQESQVWATNTSSNNLPKNIIWIVLDALRQDIFHEYLRRGGMSDLLSNGAYFHRAFAQGSWTYPSIFSFVTGRYPFNCGVSGLVLENDNLLSVCTEYDDTIPTIFSILRDHEYKVGSILDGWGFTVRETAGQVHREDQYFEQNWGWIYGQDRRFITIHDLRDVSLSFIRESVPDNPFMLFVRSLYTHAPYHGIFKNPDYVNNLSRRRWRFRLVEGFLRGLRYFESIYMDSILETLQTANQLENTIFVICSDHGDMFWNLEDDLRAGQVDDEMWRHQLEPYNALIKVPLLIGGGGVTGSVSSRFRLMDLLPSLLDELKINYNPEEFDGISVYKEGVHRPLYADSAGYGFRGVAFQENSSKLMMSDRLGAVSYKVSDDDFENISLREEVKEIPVEFKEFIKKTNRYPGNQRYQDRDMLASRLRALGYLD